MRYLAVTGAWVDQAPGVYPWLDSLVRIFEMNAPLIFAVGLTGALILTGYALWLGLQKTYHGARLLGGWLHTQLLGPIITIRYLGETARNAPGVIMAKMLKARAADIVHDALFEAWHRGELKKGDYKRLLGLLARAMDLPDLERRKYHPKAIMRRLQKNKLAGPKGKIPGAPDGTYVPAVENVVPTSKFLQKLREKQAA